MFAAVRTLKPDSSLLFGDAHYILHRDMTFVPKNLMSKYQIDVDLHDNIIYPNYFLEPHVSPTALGLSHPSGLF